MSGSVPTAELNERIADVIEDGRAEFPDFDVASHVVVSLARGRPDFAEALVELEDAHRVVARLANNPKEAARILGLPRVRMATALGQYAGRTARPAPAVPVAKPVARPATAPAPAFNAAAFIRERNEQERRPKAAEPPPTGRANLDPSKMTGAEYIAYRNRIAPRHLGGRGGR